MDTRRFNKKDLDAIGKRLFEQTAVPETQIEDIVAKPDLFSVVLKRIADDKAQEVAIAPRRIFIPQYSAAFASVLVMIAAVFGTYKYIKISSSNINDQFRATELAVSQVPVEMPVAARPDFPPKEENFGKPSPGRASNPYPVAEKVALKDPVRANSRKPETEFIEEPQGDFYPVSYAGELSESMDGGRVIRVDMTRSSLFALGINLPLENDAETVKADLLVGRDGVTRGIRVVK